MVKRRQRGGQKREKKRKVLQGVQGDPRDLVKQTRNGGLKGSKGGGGRGRRLKNAQLRRSKSVRIWGKFKQIWGRRSVIPRRRCHGQTGLKKHRASKYPNGSAVQFGKRKSKNDSVQPKCQRDGDWLEDKRAGCWEKKGSCTAKKKGTLTYCENAASIKVGGGGEESHQNHGRRSRKTDS